MCVTRRHDRLLELLEGKPTELRRLSLRELSQEDHPREVRPRDGLFMLIGRDGGGGGSGGGDAASLRRWGAFTTTSANNGPSDVNGVIPDGVGSITAIYDRAVSRGPYRNPKVYPSRFVRTVGVQDNVVDFIAPRTAEDGFPSRMIWHLSNGARVS